MRTGIIVETRLTDTEFFFSYDVRVVLFVGLQLYMCLNFTLTVAFSWLKDISKNDRNLDRNKRLLKFHATRI